MTATTKKKYVSKEVLEDFSFPKENQSILKIIKSEGNNLHQVLSSTGEEFLASMPPKFRKHIWIKRGDYVISEPIPEGRKVKAEIVRILLKEQVKYFKDNNVWPEAFWDKSNECDKEDVMMPKISNEDDDDDEDEDDVVFCNPNKPVKYYESEESSSEENDDDFGEGDISEDESENEDTTEGNDITIGERDSSEEQHISNVIIPATESLTSKSKHL